MNSVNGNFYSENGQFPQEAPYPSNFLSSNTNGWILPISPEDIKSLKWNYWLSVFFTFIPAAIYYGIKRGSHPLIDSYLKSNLWFSIIRGMLGMIQATLAGYITFSVQYASLTTGEIPDLIPYSMVYRFVTTPLVWVLLVVHIVLAATLVSRIKEGKKPLFFG